MFGRFSNTRGSYLGNPKEFRKMSRYDLRRHGKGGIRLIPDRNRTAVLYDRAKMDLVFCDLPQDGLRFLDRIGSSHTWMPPREIATDRLILSIEQRRQRAASGAKLPRILGRYRIFREMFAPPKPSDGFECRYLRWCSR